MRQLETVLRRLQQRPCCTDGTEGSQTARRPPLAVEGDFNALTREDYTQAEWDDIAWVRCRGSWEPPVTDVTTRMAEAAFTDCWWAAGCVGNKISCRFDSRIDYIWADQELLRG